MHRAFWDILRSHLEADPPDYKPVLSLLEEVKQVRPVCVRESVRACV